MTDDKGTTRYSTKAVENLIKAAVCEVPGVIALDAKLAGLGGRGFPRVLVQLDPTTELAAVDLTIATVWPAPVTAVAQKVQAVTTDVLSATLGYRVTRVNVNIGQAEPGQRVSEAEVNAYQAPTPRTVSVSHASALAAAPRSVHAPQPTPLRPITVVPLFSQSINHPKAANHS